MTWSNTLEPFLLPPGMNLIVALLGLALYRLRPFAGKLLVLLSLISLWLFSTPFFAFHLINSLQNQYPVLNSSFVPPAHAAIVVLGAGNPVYVEQGNKRAISEMSLGRLRYGAYLHKKTKLPLIVSGGSLNGLQESVADSMLTSLRQDFNIPYAIKEGKSKTTAEESQALISILRDNHIELIYLVTHAWHMPRSVYIFKQMGISVIPAPMGYTVYDYDTSFRYLPYIHALAVTSTAMHEYIGLLWYRWRY